MRATAISTRAKRARFGGLVGELVASAAGPPVAQRPAAGARHVFRGKVQRQDDPGCPTNTVCETSAAVAGGLALGAAGASRVDAATVPACCDSGGCSGLAAAAAAVAAAEELGSLAACAAGATAAAGACPVPVARGEGPATSASAAAAGDPVEEQRRALRQAVGEAARAVDEAERCIFVALDEAAGVDVGGTAAAALAHGRTSLRTARVAADSLALGGAGGGGNGAALTGGDAFASLQREARLVAVRLDRFGLRLSRLRYNVRWAEIPTSEGS